MALIVETGTGSSTANSLASVADADAYHLIRDNTAWAALTTAAKEAALVKASAYLCDEVRFPWIGTKAQGYAQRMPWPRTSASEADGSAIPDTVVPWRIVDACCELAGVASAGTDLNPALERGGQVKSESVGSISVTYMDGAPLGTVYQAAFGLVHPLLKERSKLTVGPKWSGGTGATFSLGMHDVSGDAA